MLRSLAKHKVLYKYYYYLYIEMCNDINLTATQKFWHMGMRSDLLTFEKAANLGNVTLTLHHKSGNRFKR